MYYQNAYATVVKDITPQQIWAIWSDINKRHTWDSDTEWAQIEGEFKAGNTFKFQPVGGSKLTMLITECTENKSFTDCFKFPLAKLYGRHEITEVPEGIEVKTTIIVKGLLAPLWQKLVGEKIIRSLPEQTDLLIKAAKKVTVS